MGIKIKDDKIRVSTDGPKKISFTPYNIQYLMGLNQNKNLRYKFNEEQENKNKINNNRNNYLKNYFKDQINILKDIKSNTTLNENEE